MSILLGNRSNDGARAATALVICHLICAQEALLVLTSGVPKKMHAFVATETRKVSLSTSL